MVTLPLQMWSHCPCKCGHTSRTNVITLPVQMWSHCPCKCGHTARANVVTLSVQMWSHWPDKCGHTARANVVTLSGQMWSPSITLTSFHYVLCVDHISCEPPSQHIWTYLGSWYNLKPCWSIDFTESHDTRGAEVGVEAGLQTQSRRPEKDSQLTIRLGNESPLSLFPSEVPKPKDRSQIA